MVHDVSGVNVANDLVEDEAGRDNFPNVFAFCGFILYAWFRYIAPMAFVLGFSVIVSVMTVGGGSRQQIGHKEG